MRNLMLALGATTMVLPTLIATTHDADARKRHSYREWRGRPAPIEPLLERRGLA